MSTLFVKNKRSFYKSVAVYVTEETNTQQKTRVLMPLFFNMGW